VPTNGHLMIHGADIVDKNQLDSLCGEIRMLKARTDHMERQLSLAGKENEILWTEVAQAKERQELLQRRMSKIIIFLAKTFGSGGLALKDDSAKRRRVEGSEENVAAAAETLLRGDSDENLVQFLIDITGSDLKPSDLDRTAGNTGNVTPAAPTDLFSQHRRPDFTLPPIIGQQFPFQTASPVFNPLVPSVTGLPTAVASSRYNWAAVPENSPGDEVNLEQCQQGVLRRLMEFQNSLEIEESPFQ
jgi:hypothetical protein